MSVPVIGLIVSTASCLIFSMFCSLFEAAFYAVPESLVLSRVKERKRSWLLLGRLKKNPDHAISGILITNTLANTAGAFLAGWFAEQVFEGGLGVAIFSAALVLSILWISEILPKTVGVVFSRQLAPICVWPIQGLVIIWRPLIKVFELSTSFIKRRGAGAPTVTQVELASLARQSADEGEIRNREAQLIEHVLRLDTVRARDLMTPRTVVAALSDKLRLEDIRESALQWNHSRLPVYRGDDSDDIYAVCLRREIFDAIARDEIAGKTIADYSSKIDLIPEGVSAHALIDKFINSRQHISAVIDEFGAFVGIVTLEDVIECLLGKEIVDEYDLHTDMQRFARDQARRQGLPVTPSDTAPRQDSSAERNP